MPKSTYWGTRQPYIDPDVVALAMAAEFAVSYSDPGEKVLRSVPTDYAASVIRYLMGRGYEVEEMPPLEVPPPRPGQKFSHPLEGKTEFRAWKVVPEV